MPSIWRWKTISTSRSLGTICRSRTPTSCAQKLADSSAASTPASCKELRAEESAASVLAHPEQARAARLAARREQLFGRLRRELPEVKFREPEATYLAWLDFTALHLPLPAGQFFLENAGIGASPGENFDPDAGSSFLRLNFATSEPILDEILDRMVRAVRANAGAG